MTAAPSHPDPARHSGEWQARVEPPRGLHRPVRLDPTGRDGPTEGQARGRAWRRVWQGWYLPASVRPTTPEQRVLEASVLLPEGGAVTGWAALRWRGAGYADGLGPDGLAEEPVPLLVGPVHRVRRRAGVALVRESPAADEWTLVRGVPCATPARALVDAMRQARSLRDAVVCADLTFAAELTSPARVATQLARHERRRGVRLARRALALADERAASPGETRTRLVWTLDAGLPRPLVNQPVFDLRGRLLGIADLFDPEAGMVCEYDGAAHRFAGRHRRDVMREHRFREAGLEYVKVVARDLHEVDVLVERLLTTRARASWSPAGERRWTTTPPEGWYDDPLDALGLDDRLAYRALLHGDT